MGTTFAMVTAATTTLRFKEYTMIAIITPLPHLGGIPITAENMHELLDYTDGIYLAVSASNTYIFRGTWRAVFDFCMKYGYNQFEFR